jgi:hypothetical protein
LAIRECFRENRFEFAVDFDYRDFVGDFREFAGQYPDSRPDFKYKACAPVPAFGGILRDRLSHSRAHRRVNQEILSEGLGERESVAVHEVFDDAYISEFHDSPLVKQPARRQSRRHRCSSSALILL